MFARFVSSRRERERIGCGRLIRVGCIGALMAEECLVGP